MVKVPLDTRFPVTITTAEEFRLLEQEHLGALSRRGAFSIRSGQAGTHATGPAKVSRSVSRTFGLISIAVSFLGIGMLVFKRKIFH